MEETAHLGLERWKGAPGRRCARKGAAGRGNSEGKGCEVSLMRGEELWFGVMSQGRKV